MGNNFTWTQAAALSVLGAWAIAFFGYYFNATARRLEAQRHDDTTRGNESQRLLDYIERLQADAARDGTHRGELEKCVTSLRELVIRQGLELFARRNERTHIESQVSQAVEYVEGGNAAGAVKVLRDLLRELGVDVAVPEIDLGE